MAQYSCGQHTRAVLRLLVHGTDCRYFGNAGRNFLSVCEVVDAPAWLSSSAPGSSDGVITVISHSSASGQWETAKARLRARSNLPPRCGETAQQPRTHTTPCPRLRAPPCVSSCFPFAAREGALAGRHERVVVAPDPAWLAGHCRLGGAAGQVPCLRRLRQHGEGACSARRLCNTSRRNLARHNLARLAAIAEFHLSALLRSH